MRKSVIIITIMIVYSFLHAWWVAENPPMRNDDHFIADTVLTQLDNATLYPTDLAWSDTTFADNWGIGFVSLLQMGQAITGSYIASFTFYSFWLTLIYLGGFYLWINYITENPLLALTLSIISTLPIYLYISFANWGITSLYGHVFITALSGWYLFGFWKLRDSERSFWQWGCFGALLALTVYINPVNGAGLLGILGFILLAETFQKQLLWQNLGGFMVGSIFAILPFLLNYLGDLGVQDTQADIATANEFMVNFYGERLFPWVWEQGFAIAILGGVALHSLLLLTTDFDQLPRYQRWAGIALQIGLTYTLIGHPMLLLAFAYWVFHPQPDTTDKRLLLMLAATHLLGSVAGAIGHTLWIDAQIQGFFTVAFETIRLERWAMVPVYGFIAKWIAELLTDKNKLSWIAAACMLATILSIFGSNNPVKDHPILMKTLLPMRWVMPLFAISLVWIIKTIPEIPQQLRQMMWISFMAFGLIFAVTMNPVSAIAPQGLLIIGGFILAMVALLPTPERQYEPIFLGGFFILTIILPVGGYHQNTDNINWCNPPQLVNCATREPIEEAGQWLQNNTSIEARLHIIGLQPERFQPIARRTTLHVNYSQIFWYRGAGALLEALPIADQLVGTQPTQSDYIGDDALLETLESLNTDYIVVINTDYAFDNPIAFENEEVTIYDIRTNNRP